MSSTTIGLVPAFATTRREFIKRLGAAAAAAALLGGCSDPEPAQPEEASGGGFPVTVEHKYGETVIPRKPQRVATVMVADHDFLLALGVVPVGIQDWYGGHPYGVWPWAQPALGDAKPQVYEGDINFETIASLNPDLIVGVREGITEEEYRLLSQIAPTVVQPKAHAGKVTPWQEILTVIAASVGESRKAADIKQQFEERIDRIRDAHPDWQGKTAVFVNPESGKPHAYASFDNRSKLLTDLGFVIPPAIDVIAEGTNFAYLSLEDLSPIDADVLVWYAYEDNVTPIRELELRRLMRAVREGREVVADDLLSGAWSFLSPLSIPYVLDNIEREIEAAVDGNPATGVPSAVKYGLVS